MGAVLAAPFGLVIGSFLNVVAYRLPLQKSIAFPASHCPSCETPVKPYDNVPVVSWLLLRGRCRGCGERISPRYPAVELLTAVAFTAIVLVNGANARLALELPFAALLIAVSEIDLEHRIIPNKLLLPAAAWGLAGGALLRTEHLQELVGAGAGAFTFLLITALIHPKGMGMGDVKLAGVMGLYLGASIVPAMLIAFLSGSVVGAVMLARDGMAARKSGVPFGPFLALGGLVALLAGPDLIHLYTTHFL
jgi:leader peptidase (prepilin peptidase) / N-methyltransferase